MRAFSLVSLVVAAFGLLATGCSSTLETYTCSRDRDCQSSEAEGYCEDSKVCSFLDFDCPSGRRYGKLAGESSNACVDSGERDASVIDARDDFRIDAMPGAPDAMPVAPDAMPAAPDAMIACGTTTLGSHCPAIDICPNDPGGCCNYMLTAVDTDCSALCADLGLTCDGAANAVSCFPTTPRSCGAKNDSLLCACN